MKTCKTCDGYGQVSVAKEDGTRRLRLCHGCKGNGMLDLHGLPIVSERARKAENHVAELQATVDAYEQYRLKVEQRLLLLRFLVEHSSAALLDLNTVGAALTFGTSFPAPKGSETLFAVRQELEKALAATAGKGTNDTSM